MQRLWALALVLVVTGGCHCAQKVECASDAECDFPTRGRCDLTSGQCVECVSSDQCTSGQCQADGTCAQCVRDDQCPPGSVCTEAGLCAVGCSNENGTCPKGQKCLPGTELCVACVDSNDCGVGRVCTADHLCVPGCSASHPSCPSGTVCNVASGTCVPCNGNVDCKSPGLPYCDLGTNQCVRCVTNAHCASPTPVCDPSTDTCVECVTDTHCPAGKLCQANQCVPGCTASHGCGAGKVCDTSTSTCVGCLGDSDCPGGRCEPASRTCVACLPGATDNCPAGNYCRADFVCERGCKSNLFCPSGVCLPDHSCSSCTLDSQCAAGKVCQAGSCIDACSASNPCGNGLSCCNDHCVSLAADEANCGSCGNTCSGSQTCCNGACAALDTIQNCGSCGNVCATGEDCCGGTCKDLSSLSNCGACNVLCPADHFCDGTACRPQTFPNFCANKQVYVLYDGIAIDDGAGNVLASTVVQNCSSQTQLTYSQQTNPLLVDQTTGAPLAGGGVTYVLAGGPYPHKVVKWLERTNQVTKVYFDQNGTTENYFRRRSDNMIVSTIASSACSSQRDHFVLELVTDPVNGTLSLIGYGVCTGGYGTQAAAWYWANVMLPNRASYPDSWYVFEWLDGDANATAGPADTFTILASGK